MANEIKWLDGRFIVDGAGKKGGGARFDLLTHGLHYGSGAFEGIRAYETARGTAVFRLADHVKRFYRSAAALGIKIPYSKKVFERAILQTVAKNKLRECYIRPIVFYGEGEMRLMPERAKVHVAVAAWPWPAYLGEHAALSICVSPFVRFHPKSIAPGVKISGLYATSVMATLDARSRGFAECIMLDCKGNVAEGPGENIFIIRRGKLFTPDSPSILKGITRASVMQIARDLGISAAEKKISLRELLAADEAFFTGTAAEVATIGKVNGRRIGGIGSITERIRETYLAAVHGELPKYRKWLSHVRNK